jgi:hypothetical protein
VEDLAERLGEPMTIRHHLNVLQAQSLVAASKVPPRRSGDRGWYIPSPKRRRALSQHYGELARQKRVKESVGQEQTEAIFRRWLSACEEAPRPGARLRASRPGGRFLRRAFEPLGKERRGYVRSASTALSPRQPTAWRGLSVGHRLIRRLLGVEPKRELSMATGGRRAASSPRPGSPQSAER